MADAAKVTIHTFSTDRVSNRVAFGASTLAGHSINLNVVAEATAPKGQDAAKIALKAELDALVADVEAAIDAS